MGVCKSKTGTNVGKSVLKNFASIFVFTAVILLLHAGVFAITFTAVSASPNSDTQVCLSWSTVADAKIYQISRLESGDITPVIVATIDVDTSLNYNCYNDTGLTPETTYDYTISAYSDTNMQIPISIQNNTVEVTTSPCLRLLFFHGSMILTRMP